MPAEQSSWLSGLDRYELQARFAPGALVAVSVVAVGVAFGLRDNAVVSVVGGLVGLGVLSFLLATMARSLGRPIEHQLTTTRNGKPTTHALRLQSDEWPDQQRLRWREAAQKATNCPLSDNGDRADLDGEIDAVVENLRRLTRNAEEYPLVCKENTSYGFQRNLLGVRKLGLTLAILALLAAVGGSIVSVVAEDAPWSLTELIVAALIAASMAVFFSQFPSSDRVWDAGRSYTERLMEAAVTIAEGASNVDGENR